MDNPNNESDRQNALNPPQLSSLSSELTPVIPTFLMRFYISSHHHFAASHFLELAREIEESHDGRPIFDIKHRAYVTNSIFSSVAFMEAAINETFQDATDEHRGSLAPLNIETKTNMASFWEIAEGRNRSAISILDKYQTALLLADKPRFNEALLPFKDARTLIEIRNELMHYKPESLGGSKTHKLEKKLKDQGKFPPNRLMAGAGNPFFPDHCLGFGCAEWGLNISKSFVDHFFRELDITPNYQRMPFINK